MWLALASGGGGFDSPQLVLADFARNANGWQVSKHPRMMADVNNDTRQDIVGFGDYGVSIALSNGSGFNAAQLVLGDFGYLSGWRVGLHPRYIADLNADGYKDIVGFGQESVYRALGGPNGFTSIRGVLRDLVAAEYPYSLNSNGQWAPQFVGDISGDGMADLITFGDMNVMFAKSGNTPPPDPPKAPSNVRVVSATETSLTFAWDDNSDDERRFFTYFSEPGEPKTRHIWPANAEKAFYPDLEPDTRYCFNVEAENIWGISNSHRPVCGTTEPRPEPTPTPTPEQTGVSRIDVLNCNSEEHAVQLWLLNAQNIWSHHGAAPSNWVNGGCSLTATPTKVPLPDGQWVWFVAVDTNLPGCGQNDPNLVYCRRSQLLLFGKANGPVFKHTVN